MEEITQETMQETTQETIPEAAPEPTPEPAPEQAQEKRRFPVWRTVLCVLLFVLAAAYGAGVYYFQTHFLKGTVIDRADVSFMTAEELESRIDGYMLRIVERKSDGTTLEEDIQGKEIGLAYASEDPFGEILRTQNPWLWFWPQAQEYESDALVSYNEEKLEGCIGALSCFQDSFSVAPTDAYIAAYTPEDGFQIVPETQGNMPDQEKTYAAVRAAVESLAEMLDLDAEGCYETPQVTSDSEELQATFQELQSYADITITYTFGDETEVLDGETISGWLIVDGFDISLDQDQVDAFVAGLRKRHDTIFRSRTFQTSYGKEITIDGGDYGWWMNYEQEAEELTQMIANHESGERTPVYYQTAASYGTPDYGDTYVEINLTAQHLFLYVEGELILESDLVSGNAAKGYDTPVGVYSVTYKQRNATLVGENYETPVSYWMPFNKNIGMHDATWRSSFGGNIYRTNGSHGCINLPYSVAQKIYENISKGTPVICYELPGTEPVTETEEEEK